MQTPSETGKPRLGSALRRSIRLVCLCALAVAFVVIAFPLLDYMFAISDRLGLPFGLTSHGASRRAYYRLEAGDLDGALKFADRAISANPNFCVPYELRGRVYDLKGDYERAIRDYSMAIKVDPDFRYVLVYRARAYEKIGKVDLAIADYRAVILPVGAYRPLELAAQRTGRAAPSLRAEVEFLASHPADCGASLAEVVRLFDDAIKRHPDDKDLQTCRSWLSNGKRGHH